MGLFRRSSAGSIGNGKPVEQWGPVEERNWDEACAEIRKPLEFHEIDYDLWYGEGSTPDTSRRAPAARGKGGRFGKQVKRASEEPRDW